MENASKALIIAGAILISILLISVGIMVMNSVNKPIDEVADNANSQATQIFNSKFTIYEGDNKSAQDVKSLLSAVEANKDASHQVFIRTVKIIKNKAQDGSDYCISRAGETIGYINSGEKYKITMIYNIGGGATSEESFMIGNNSDIKAINGNKNLQSEPGYICLIQIEKK